MKSFTTVIPFIKRHKWDYIIGIIFLLGVDLLQMIIPHLLGSVTDLFKSKDLTPKILLNYSLWIIGISLLVFAFRFIWRIKIMGMSRLLEKDLREDLFSKLLTLSPQYYHEHKTGDLMAHATNDINAIRMVAGPGIIMSIDASFLSITIILIMIFTINFKLTLFALLPLPVLALVVNRFGKIIHARFTKVQEAFASLTDKVQESISGIRVIKAFVQEKEEIENFRQENFRNFLANMNMIKIWGLFDPAVQFLAALSFTIALLYGGTQVIRGVISLGEFVAFTAYLGMLIWPMMAFGWVINIFQRGAASMERINVILNEVPEITDKFADPNITTIKGDIEIKNLTFSYKKDLPPVLKNINLKIPRGKTLAIIGKTGSGKSTLVNLIARLYTVPCDKIFIDGHDINEIPLKVLRENIGFVPQDNFIFSDTIANNIAFTKEEPLEKIQKFAEMADVHKDIVEFPQQYDTVVGERGVTLSGGQKQRIAIARALIKDPKILILDDSLSAVDTNTEERILNNLKEFMKDRTTIIASHRISTIKNADEIIVLDEGEIVERGTHEELLNLKGLYYSIYEKQQLEEAIQKEG
ncbi:ABC transporter ATP-binding protein [Caldanaerobacter subterraneus]|uniref:ABC transporter ATP-binding protein n=1 Tax=Caldanaerobacter subterraneus TaxID=911092 RepID=A0A7Y2L5V8_9THEO|nr:ABC transporter ATP-binding protein [Caldanaerobacter subterraneus]NNG65850.1 ABC transporter ATP-binding protein [Caldanaerobacter subterraneus]